MYVAVLFIVCIDATESLCRTLVVSHESFK